MNRFNIEFGVGLFLIAGILSLAYLSVRLANVGFLSDETYTVSARFLSVSWLKEGASVELAGVRVGKVTEVDLDSGAYEAVVHMAIDKGVELSEDSIASIRTSGIIGDKFVKLTPGGSDVVLAGGDEIFETESAISIEELVSKYIFESK